MEKTEKTPLNELANSIYAHAERTRAEHRREVDATAVKTGIEAGLVVCALLLFIGIAMAINAAQSGTKIGSLVAALLGFTGGMIMLLKCRKSQVAIIKDAKAEMINHTHAIQDQAKEAREYHVYG